MHLNYCGEHATISSSDSLYFCDSFPSDTIALPSWLGDFSSAVSLPKDRWVVSAAAIFAIAAMVGGLYNVFVGLRDFSGDDIFAVFCTAWRLSDSAGVPSKFSMKSG